MVSSAYGFKTMRVASKRARFRGKIVGNFVGKLSKHPGVTFASHQCRWLQNCGFECFL